MSHTVGPWKASVYCVWGGQFGDTYIAGTKTGIPNCEQLSNARLISAAPDLLAALEAANLWLNSDRELVDGERLMDESTSLQISAAIAKAKAVQP